MRTLDCSGARSVTQLGNHIYVETLGRAWPNTDNKSIHLLCTEAVAMSGPERANHTKMMGAHGITHSTKIFIFCVLRCDMLLTAAFGLPQAKGHIVLVVNAGPAPVVDSLLFSTVRPARCLPPP